MYEEFYDKLAKIGGSKWQARMYSAPHQRQRLEQIKHMLLSRIREATILEVGCANGLMTGWLAEYASWVDALEISSEALKYAPEYPNVTYIHGDVTTLTPQRKYDIIIASEVMEHLEEPKLQMNKFRAWLKPAGVILISGPISEQRNPDAFNIDLLGRETKPGDATGHIHTYKPDMWEGLFNNLVDHWTNGISWVGLGR